MPHTASPNTVLKEKHQLYYLLRPFNHTICVPVYLLRELFLIYIVIFYTLLLYNKHMFILFIMALDIWPRYIPSDQGALMHLPYGLVLHSIFQNHFFFLTVFAVDAHKYKTLYIFPQKCTVILCELLTVYRYTVSRYQSAMLSIL